MNSVVITGVVFSNHGNAIMKMIVKMEVMKKVAYINLALIMNLLVLINVVYQWLKCATATMIVKITLLQMKPMKGVLATQLVHQIILNVKKQIFALSRIGFAMVIMIVEITVTKIHCIVPKELAHLTVLDALTIVAFLLLGNFMINKR